MLSCPSCDQSEQVQIAAAGGGVTRDWRGTCVGCANTWDFTDPGPQATRPPAGPASAGRAPQSVAVVRGTAQPIAAGGSPVSAQALQLHALGLETSIRLNTGGLLGRRQAEQLAEQCGALVSELVETGFWLETDLSYFVRVGTARTGWGERPLDPEAPNGGGPILELPTG